MSVVALLQKSVSSARVAVKKDKSPSKIASLLDTVVKQTMNHPEIRRASDDVMCLISEIYDRLARRSQKTVSDALVMKFWVVLAAFNYDDSLPSVELLSWMTNAAQESITSLLEHGYNRQHMLLLHCYVHTVVENLSESKLAEIEASLLSKMSFFAFYSGLALDRFKGNDAVDKSYSFKESINDIARRWPRHSVTTQYYMHSSMMDYFVSEFLLKIPSPDPEIRSCMRLSGRLMSQGFVDGCSESKSLDRFIGATLDVAIDAVCFVDRACIVVDHCDRAARLNHRDA